MEPCRKERGITQCHTSGIQGGWIRTQGLSALWSYREEADLRLTSSLTTGSQGWLEVNPRNSGQPVAGI
jgi:hypothetical protein